MAQLMFFAVVAIWSVSFLLMKKATICFSPAAIAVWRLLGGAGVVWLAWWYKYRRLAIERRHGWAVAFVVMFNFVVPFVVQPLLIGRHGSAFVGMTVGFVPLLTVLVSIPLLGVHPTFRQVMGVIGALAFLLMLLYDGVQRRIPIADLGLAATIPVGYAISNTVIRRWLRDVPPLELAAICLVLAAILVSPLAWTQTVSEVRAGITISALLAVIVLGIIGTGVAQVMFNSLIRERGPLYAGMISNLVPAGAVMWGMVDGELITTWQVVALTGIMSMVLVVQFSSRATVSHAPKPD